MIEGCANATRIADPVARCAAVRAHCDPPSIIPYASLVFCYLSGTAARVLLLAVLVMLSFAAMGMAAFDHLSVNLTHLAELSGLSQSLMGVTVLAFGNGSVDVFGAVVALGADEGGLAFGEIMGGALFVCSVVVGSMALVSPFDIDPQFILRDTAVLAVSVVFTMAIVANGTVSIFEALLGFLMYIAYAAFVVHQQLGNAKRHKDDTSAGAGVPADDDEALLYAAAAAAAVAEPAPATSASTGASISASLLEAGRGSTSPVSQASAASFGLDAPFTPLRPSLYSAFDMSWKVNEQLGAMASSSRAPSPLVLDDASRVAPPGEPSPLAAAPGVLIRRTSAPAPETPHVAPGARAPEAPLSSESSPRLLPSHYVPLQHPQHRLQNAASKQQHQQHQQQHQQPTGSQFLKPPLPKLVTSQIDPAVASSLAGASHDPTEFDVEAAGRLSTSSSHTAYRRPHHLHRNAHHAHTHHRHHHHRRYADESHYKDFSMKHLVDQLLVARAEIARLGPLPDAAQDSVSECSSPDSARSISTMEMTSDNASGSTMATARTAAHPWRAWWQLLFPSLAQWHEYGWLQRWQHAVAFPIVSVLAWTIPLSTAAHSRAHVCLWSVGVPVAFPLIMPKLKLSLGVGAVAAALSAMGLLWWGRLRRPLPPALAVACIGFFMGLLWVLLLATELVAMLAVLGEVCHVSETMMGLTVFALGDSLGDFVSNLTVARIGFPTMAISACLGGPIFTLLVGVSGASLLTMVRQRRLELHVRVHRSLLLSGAGLLVILVLFAGIAHRSGNRVTKGLGLFLIGMYFAVVAGSMLVPN